MPIHRGYDKKGCYYQWGNQTKYYYKCGDKDDRKKAKMKSIKQMIAISYSSPKYRLKR
jgi:hypothetical protein